MNKKQGGATLSIVASTELVQALDTAAARHGETRSLHIRKVLAGYLRETGYLNHESPTTLHEAKRLSGQE